MTEEAGAEELQEEKAEEKQAQEESTEADWVEAEEDDLLPKSYREAIKNAGRNHSEEEKKEEGQADEEVLDLTPGKEATEAEDEKTEEAEYVDLGEGKKALKSEVIEAFNKLDTRYGTLGQQEEALKQKLAEFSENKKQVDQQYKIAGDFLSSLTKSVQSGDPNGLIELLASYTDVDEEEFAKNLYTSVLEEAQKREEMTDEEYQALREIKSTKRQQKSLEAERAEIEKQKQALLDQQNQTQLYNESMTAISQSGYSQQQLEAAWGDLETLATQGKLTQAHVDTLKATEGAGRVSEAAKFIQARENVLRVDKVLDSVDSELKKDTKLVNYLDGLLNIKMPFSVSDEDLVEIAKGYKPSLEGAKPGSNGIGKDQEAKPSEAAPTEEKKEDNSAGTNNEEGRVKPKPDDPSTWKPISAKELMDRY